MNKMEKHEVITKLVVAILEKYITVFQCLHHRKRTFLSKMFHDMEQVHTHDIDYLQENVDWINHKEHGFMICIPRSLFIEELEYYGIVATANSIRNSFERLKEINVIVTHIQKGLPNKTFVSIAPDIYNGRMKKRRDKWSSYRSNFE